MSSPFTRDENDIYAPLCIALVLTKKSERVLVGRPDYIQSRLGRNRSAPVYCDSKRKIGMFLVEFERDPGNTWWAEAGNFLCKALEVQPRNKKKIRELEQAALDFLEKKYETGDPVCQFTALRMWFGYLRTRDAIKMKSASRREKIVEEYSEDMQRLIRPFSRETDAHLETKPERVLPDNPIFRWPQCSSSADLTIQRVYPAGKIKDEYVYATHSFMGLKAYYAEKLQLWNQCLICCSVCGRYFLAPSRHYKLCSDTCRELRKAETKAERDSTPLNKELDRLRRNGYQYWGNRLTRAKGMEGFPPELLDEFRREMNAFKAEMIKQRKLVDAGKISVRDFRNWILTHEQRAEELMGEYEAPHRKRRS